MTYTLECECDFNVDFDIKTVYESVAECTLDTLDCPYEAEVNLIITDDDEIQRINKEYRGLNKVTDVLSFPMIEYDSPADFLGLDEREDLFDPDTGELLLGDIVICASRVFDQAAEYGHSVKREFAFLIAHSMLHLSGFDHIEPEDAKVMEDKQKIILDKLSIGR